MSSLENIQPTKKLQAMYEIVRSWFPRYDFLGKYRYRVVSVESDNRVKLQAVRKIAGLPNILPVKMYPGIAGCLAKLTPSSIVLVEFIEGDPALPIISSYSDSSDGGFRPANLTIDAYSSTESSFIRIGRSSDQIILGAGDQQKIARYPEIKRFCDDALLWMSSVQTVLTGLGATPPVLPPTTLTSIASSAKVTAQ